jgi:hypothetical protein
MDISKKRIMEIIQEEYRKVREQQDTTSVIHDDLDSDVFQKHEDIILNALRRLVKYEPSPRQMERLMIDITNTIRSQTDWAHEYRDLRPDEEGPEL